MLIYKATNILNGKAYVGQTTKELEVRKRRHKDNIKNAKCKFHQAIKKYGWNNFQWEVLEYCNNQEELNQSEIFWVYRFNSYKKGYNSTQGGSFNCSTESIQQRRDKVKTPFQIVLDKFRELNYILLLKEEDHKGLRYKADYICDRGHKNRTMLYTIVEGRSICRKCKDQDRRLKYEDLYNLFQENDFTLLMSKEDVESSPTFLRKFKTSCSNGHVLDIYIHNLLRGGGCRFCFNESQKGKTISIEQLAKIKAAKINNGTYCELSEEEIEIVKNGLTSGASIYNIVKYQLNNKYSRKVIDNRIRKIKAGVL